MSELVRTLESQRVIREIAGLLSTFPRHASDHPHECVPEAEAIYGNFIGPQINELRARIATLEPFGPNTHAGVWISRETADQISKDGP